MLHIQCAEKFSRLWTWNIRTTTEWNVWCVKTMYEWMDLQHMEHMRRASRRHMWLEVIEQIFSRKEVKSWTEITKRKQRMSHRTREETKSSSDIESEIHQWESIKCPGGVERKRNNTAHTQLVDLQKKSQRQWKAAENWMNVSFGVHHIIVESEKKHNPLEQTDQWVYSFERNLSGGGKEDGLLN